MTKEDKQKALEVFNELLSAKDAVIFCLNNPKGSISFKGLSYWAGEVGRLRKELEKYI